MKFFKFIVSRLKEKGTLAVVITFVLTGLGLAISPEQQEAIVALGLGILGVVVAFMREKTVEPPE